MHHDGEARLSNMEHLKKLDVYCYQQKMLGEQKDL